MTTPGVEWPSQTVWGVTSYDLGGNSGYEVHCLFARKDSADKYASANSEMAVEEFTFYRDGAPEPYSYWHRGSAVYPDGTHEDWKHVSTAQPPGRMAEVDDHLNSLSEPWDGHTQSHCGEHISIFGTDETKVEEAFQRHLSESIVRQNGTCARCGASESYEAGFMNPRRRKA